MGAWGGASRALEPGLASLPNSQGPTPASGLLVTLGAPCETSVGRGDLRKSPADPWCPAYYNTGSALEPVQSAGPGRPLWTPPAFAACCIGLPRWQLVTVWVPSTLASDQMHTLNHVVILLPNLLFF